MLGFHGDAVLLSGPAGTRLKTRIVGDYYGFWWKITSGGPTLQYRHPTAIVDMNAATGEVYIEETNETILGSAGHALSLKYDSGLPTGALSVVLVEQNSDCYVRQKRVISRRWANVPVDQAGGSIDQNDSTPCLEIGLGGAPSSLTMTSRFVRRRSLKSIERD